MGSLTSIPSENPLASHWGLFLLVFSHWPSEVVPRMTLTESSYLKASLQGELGAATMELALGAATQGLA